MSMPRVCLTTSAPAASSSNGHTTLELSQIAYGVWRLGEDQKGDKPERVRAKIDACLELGITTFDHADIYGGYGCEVSFGKALAEEPKLRDQMEIVTKCDICLVDPARPGHRVKHYDTSGEHIRSSVEQSLRNLATDRIDLLLLHRPDPLMDAEETANVIAELHREGKVLAFGVSNFTPTQTDLLRMRLHLPIVANQIEFNALHLDPLTDGTLEHCQLHRIQPMAWSPLAGGRLFARDDPSAARIQPVLEQLSNELELPFDAVALAWLLRHPTKPIPIIGTNRIARIQSAARAAELDLDRQSWFEIYEAGLGREVP